MSAAGTIARARQGYAVHKGTGDGVDYLLGITGGDVLAPPSSSAGGEYDSWNTQVTTATKRRLNGAGLLRANGMQADQLQHVCAAYVPRVGEMTTDEFVLWYVDTALAGLDDRRDVRNGVDEWAGYDEWLADRVADGLEPDLVDTVPTASDVAPCADVWPAWIDDLFGRLVHAPKIDFLMSLVQWHYLQGPTPTVPAMPWADKLIAKFERRTGVTVPR